MAGMGPEAALLSARLAELRVLRTYRRRDRADGVSIYAAACTPIGAESDPRTYRPFSGYGWRRLRAAFRGLAGRTRPGRASYEPVDALYVPGRGGERPQPLFAMPAARLTPRGGASRTDAARVPLAGLPLCRDRSR